MKGEYEQGRGGRVSSNNNIFAKLHHQQQQQQQQQQQRLQQLHHQHLQLSRECQTSEEDESRSSGGGGGGGGYGGGGGGGASTNITKTVEGNSGDGATIEVVRRPRGRPPGSKNRPKPPLIITRDNDSNAMRPLVLEVPGGHDVVDSIARFARLRNIGLSVLTATGTVANVTLRQPSTTPGATVTFHGRFDLLSITATFLPPSTSSPIPLSANGFTISLAGPQGQIVGGSVAGSLFAAGTVVVVAASFTNPAYHRLPIEDETPINSVSTGHHSPPSTSGGGDGCGGSGRPPPAESCGMSVYSCQLPSDVIWAPTARPTPPPPPSRSPF